MPENNPFMPESDNEHTFKRLNPDADAWYECTVVKSSTPKTQHVSTGESKNSQMSLIMKEVSSMWYCPSCRAWNGTELPACLKCERQRPFLPVTSDNVPVKHSKDVTLKHRVYAKTLAALNKQ